jgi:ribosomal protein S18 acetylase RimI-like enzyme
VAPDVGEVRRLRVDPEWRRRGVGDALMRRLMEFAEESGLRVLVLNTTSAQGPALRLYGKLGFVEVGRTWIDVYELVWMRGPWTWHGWRRSWSNG